MGRPTTSKRKDIDMASRDQSDTLIRTLEQQGVQTQQAIQQLGTQTLEAIRQQGAQQADAIDRIQTAQRDYSRQMGDSIDRFAASIEKQIERSERKDREQRADPVPAHGGSHNFEMIGMLVTVVLAVASIGFLWISNVSERSDDSARQSRDLATTGIRQLQDEMHVAMREGMNRDENSLEDRRELKSEQAAMKQKLDEIETQFRAMWMMLDAELQQQDRINSFLWNYQHKDMPWEPRLYFPSMSSPPSMGAR